MVRVPAPRALPLTGHLFALGQDLPGFLERSRAHHGDLMRLRVAWMPIYVASSPGFARHVLLDRRDIYEKTSRSSREIRHIAGASLLTAVGPDWAAKRQVLHPAFKANVIGLYHDVMEVSTASALERWRLEVPEGGVLDMAQEMMRLTYGIVSSALLGEDLDQTAHEVDDALRFMLTHVVARLQAPSVPLDWPTPGNRRFHRERARLHALVDAVIARRRAAPREPRDLLDAMLQASSCAGPALDATWLRDEVATLLLSGHETTANALTWTWYLLSRHPEIQERAAAAARAAADPVSCAYLRQVLFESMRLYPPIWLVERQAQAADTLGGHAIPRGANVAVAIWLLHRHPEFWPEPERFDPERFRDSQQHGRPGDHYLPFGLGPRTCLGLNFAVHEALIVLARSLTRVRVVPVQGGTDAVPVPGVTLRPRGGLPLDIRWRD